MESLIESKNDLELKQEQKDFQPDTWKLEAAVRDPVVVGATAKISL